jgi:hypothetical protein
MTSSGPGKGEMGFRKLSSQMQPTKPAQILFLSTPRWSADTAREQAHQLKADSEQLRLKMDSWQDIDEKALKCTSAVGNNERQEMSRTSAKAHQTSAYFGRGSHQNEALDFATEFAMKATFTRLKSFADSRHHYGSPDPTAKSEQKAQ